MYCFFVGNGCAFMGLVFFLVMLKKVSHFENHFFSFLSQLSVCWEDWHKSRSYKQLVSLATGLLSYKKSYFLRNNPKTLFCLHTYQIFFIRDQVVLYITCHLYSINIKGILQHFGKQGFFFFLRRVRWEDQYPSILRPVCLTYNYHQQRISLA